MIGTIVLQLNPLPEDDLKHSRKPSPVLSLLPNVNSLTKTAGIT
jgi:hypothetical protein